MNRGWNATFEQWARRVDALLVERERGLLYALRGRTSELGYKNEEVPSEHFRQPRWQSMRGMVYVYDQGEDRQARASYVPVSIESVPPGGPIPTGREVFYDRDERGAQKAADEIAAFLKDGTMPERPTAF